MALKDGSAEDAANSFFLGDQEIGPAIKCVISAARLRCAVAFWGNGAAQNLFAGAPPPDARIICDISMGGSNPKELKRLGAPDNENLKQLPGLHAKVYLSEQGLITGSANASNNGIGFVTSANLVEAGTFHAPRTETYKQAANWFERIWACSSKIDATALALAEDMWRRKNIPPNRDPLPGSLLDAVAADPQRFRGVGFAFTNCVSTEEKRDEAAAALLDQDKKRETPILPETERARINQWDIANVFSEWPSQEVSAWPERFVCVDQSASGKVTGLFNALN